MRSPSILVYLIALITVLPWSTAWGQPEPCESVARETSVSARLAQACEHIKLKEWRKANREADDVISEDPDNLEAHLLRGMARRELERSLPFSWSNLRDFEFVIERDSTFRDVLYEYAVALTYREGGKQERKALALADRQIELKPELIEPRLGIFDVYRYYIRVNRVNDVKDALAGRDSEYARFFAAEVERREGNLSTAEGALSSLLQHTALPDIPVLLALARIRYAQGDDAGGQAFVERALDSIEEPLDAYFVFRDFKYVLTPDEYTEFAGLSTSEGMQAFLRSLFEKRDPMPAAEVNLRLADHYRRLIHAEKNYVHFGSRSWARNPDKFTRLSFPPTFDLAAEFDDRGIIYIRHGEPDDRAAVMDIEGVHSESWHYAPHDMDFHFRTETSMSPRLHPLPAEALLDDLALWDSDYRGLAKDRELLEERVIRKSIAYVDSGLTSDHFTLKREITPVEMPVITALFRADGGMYELHVFYALPVGELNKGVEGSEIYVEVGAAIHDSTWQIVDETRLERRIPRVSDVTAATLDHLQVDVVPGRYHLSMHAREPSQNRIAAVKAEVDASVYGDVQLDMSDVVPAFAIRKSADPNSYARGDFYITANPTLTFPMNSALHAYFEVYNLTYGADDQTHYSTEYRLESHEKHGKFLGIFGGDTITLAVKATGEGSDRSPAEHGEIDVSDVPGGRYDLIVTVTDETTGESVSRSRELLLLD